MVIEFINPVQEHLQEVEARMRSRFNGNTSGLGVILEQFFRLRGMRLRPTLTLLFGQMFGAELDHLLDLAAATEMLHTATLIHDDLVDDTPVRHATKAINAAWPPLASVLAGDLVFAIAANLAADTKSVRVMEMFAETLATIVDGEISNLFGNQHEFDRDVYYRWLYGKTASIYELAAGAAAILSPVVDNEAVSTARQFGRNIGVAFQIVEDVLDFIGTQVDIGQPIGNDLRQGLLTLPTLKYFETHPEDPDLHSIINHNGHDEESLNRLIAAINASDAIDRSMHEAERLVQSSIDALTAFPDNLARQTLEELARYLLRRKK